MVETTESGGMKICKDILCTRGNSPQGLSDFPRDRRSNDGRYVYCKACCRRRTMEARKGKDAGTYQKLVRKPNVLATHPYAFSLVYEAIQKSYRTREQIQRFTKLDYDSIGDALVEHLYVAKSIVIQNREYVPIEELVNRKEAA